MKKVQIVNLVKTAKSVRSLFKSNKILKIQKFLKIQLKAKLSNKIVLVNLKRQLIVINTILNKSLILKSLNYCLINRLLLIFRPKLIIKLNLTFKRR